MRVHREWDNHALVWSIRANPPKPGAYEPDWQAVADHYFEITGQRRSRGEVRFQCIGKGDPSVFDGMTPLEKAALPSGEGRLSEIGRHRLDDEAERVLVDIRASRRVQDGCMPGDTREQELAARAKTRGLDGRAENSRMGSRIVRDPRQMMRKMRNARIEADKVHFADKERERYWA